MSRLAVLCGLLVVNACSLIFEVIAARKAATYLGATAYAHSAVISALLAGLGLGAALAARPSGLQRRTRACGGLLVFAGLFVTMFSPAITWLGMTGPSGFVARGLVLTLLTLPVGLAVGFAYPALTAVYAQCGTSVARSAAATYCADTLGASAGALAAGFFLVPWAGLRVAGILAGLALAVTGGLVLLVLLAPEPPTPLARVRGEPPARTRLLFAVFVATGFSALALEVTWIRLFTLVIGTSIFSFALTVAAFLAALGAGSQIIRGRVETIKDPAAALARILILTGTSAPTLLLLSPAWERLYFAAHRSLSNVVLFETAVFGLGLLSLLVPAGLMGAGFALGVRLVSPGACAAESVGRLYGFNTLGGVLGGLAAGLVLLPAFGIKGCLLGCAGIYLVAGYTLGLKSAAPAGRRHTHVIAAGTAGILILVGMAPEPGMFFAPYFHGLRLGAFEEFSRARDQERIQYRRFSPYGLVTVTEDASHRYLRHNGRSEASTNPGDMSAQLLLAHLPLLMHPSPKRVLNIGLGAGFTLGAIERHLQIELIVQVELDPRVVDAAKEHFADVNGDALEDPRLRLHVTDGRELLANQPARYDVIISEPSHLWVSGASGLFTSEFDRIVAGRLAPGGIFATWIPRYEMGPEDLRIVAATLLDEFVHVTAFENGPADIIFLSSNAPFSPARERVRAAMEVAAVRLDLSRALAGFPLDPESLSRLLEQTAATAARMPQSVTSETPRNTDDWPVLEFHTALAAVNIRAERTEQGP